MCGERHELPELGDKVDVMKTGNGHFAKLVDACHDVDREIRRIAQVLKRPPDDPGKIG